MRLFEIDMDNAVWAKLADIDLDVDNTFNEINQVLSLLEKLKNPRHNRNSQSVLDDDIQKLTDIIDGDWVNQDDPDLPDLKQKAKRHRDEAIDRKNKLPM